MDNQKTGRLIAARRTELGLTQKQLGDRLSLSDRTISRWERGIGFPDISLLEPLADELGLSVLELLRGERMEAPQAETETAIRETTRSFGTRFKTTLRRLRWALVVLVMLFVITVVLIVGLQSQGYLHPWIGTEGISATKAVSICPFALITTEEYDVARQLLSDEDLIRYLPDMYDESHIITQEDIFSADESILRRYEGRLSIEGTPAELTSIEVIYSTIYVTYDCGTNRCFLLIHSHSGSIEKHSAQYAEGADLEVLYFVGNRNNETFFMAKESIQPSLSKDN